MTRDYKPTSRKQNTGRAGVFFAGLFVGLIIGVVASLGVAMFVKGGESPFTTNGRTEDPATGQAAPLPAPVENADANAPDQADRFDFYKILPRNESIVTDQQVRQNETAQPQGASNDKASVQYYLQVGAFQTEQEADNLKAKLAFIGVEALVQTATIPDKGVLHRVRVGPYTTLDQITRVRGTLSQNGFNADLVKTQN